MPLPLAWAFAVASTVLGAEVRLDGAVRLEGRSSTVDGETDRVTSVEVSTRPLVALSLLGADLRALATYAPVLFTPVLRTPELQPSLRTEVFQAGALAVRYQLGPAWLARADAAAEGGVIDLFTEARLRGMAPDTVPTAGTIRYGAARVDAGTSGSLDPLTRVALSAGWFAGGGLDGPSRDLMPFQRGLRGEARADWSATAVDRLAAEATAQGARFSDGHEAAYLTLLGRWRHRLDPFAETTLGAGATGARERTPTGVAAGPGSPDSERLAERVLPAGEVGLTHSSSRTHLAESVFARLSSSLDPASGLVDTATSAELSVRWDVREDVSYAATGNASWVRRAPGDARRVYGELRHERRISAYASLSLGAYVGSQRSLDPSLPTFAEFGAFLALTADPGRRPATSL